MNKEKLIENIGSQLAVADLFGVIKQAVSKWGTNIPTKRVKQLTQIIDKDFLHLFGETVINNGYNIVPLPHASKYPAGVPDWNNMKMSVGSISFWVKDKGYDGIGVLGKSTPAVDIDVHSTELSNKLVEFITDRYPTCLKRVGQVPKVLIPFKTDKPLKKRYIGFTDAQGTEHKVEILADGQQWAACGVHPDTGLPYQWLDDGNSILNVPHDDLPVLTKDFIDELFEYVKTILPEGAKLGISASSKAKRGGLENVSSTVDMSVDKIKVLLEPINADDYDVYLKVGQALHHQFEGSDEGLAIWHEWASGSIKYKDEELDYKWKGFSEVPVNGKPVTMRTVITLNSLSQEQAAKGKIEKMLQRYVYVANKEEVVDLECVGYKNIKSLKAFKSEQRNSPILRVDNKGTVKEKVVRLNPADVWMEHPKRITAVDYGYLPGEERLYNDVDGMLMMNQFSFPEHPTNTGVDTSFFYEHVSNLIPIEAEAKCFIDWVAWKLQNPAKRSEYAVLHISPTQGTGRSSLIKLLRRVFGFHNTSSVNPRNLLGESNSYNDFMFDNLLCYVEEIKLPRKDYYGLSESLKELINAEAMETKIKHKANVFRQVYPHFIFLSNEIDALPLSENDRRLLVFYSDAEVKSEEYGKQVEAMASSDEFAAALFHELLSRDVSGFDYVRPMKTEGLRKVLADNKNDAQRAIDDLVASPPKALMTGQEVVDYLHSTYQGEDYDLHKLSKVYAERMLRNKRIKLHEVKVYEKRKRLTKRLWVLKPNEFRNSDDINNYYINLRDNSGVPPTPGQF